MTKNPILNAFAASAYIIFGVTVMNFVTQSLRNKPDTFFAPVVILSLLTLSTAVMAYLFFTSRHSFLSKGKNKR